jgi:hypothetical protein
VEAGKRSDAGCEALARGVAVLVWWSAAIGSCARQEKWRDAFVLALVKSNAVDLSLSFSLSFSKLLRMSVVSLLMTRKERVDERDEKRQERRNREDGLSYSHAEMEISKRKYMICFD